MSAQTVPPAVPTPTPAKGFWKSKTFWGIVGLVFAFVKAKTGWTWFNADASAWESAVNIVIPAVSGLVALNGRHTATQPITPVPVVSGIADLVTKIVTGGK